jgi:outer membrane autotransporter protein
MPATSLRQSSLRRASFLVNTALATGVLAGVLLGADPAFADGECGVSSPTSGTVTCTSTTGTGNPYANGIAYTPSGGLTLILDPTVVVNNSQSSVDSFGPVQYGVAVPTPVIPFVQGNLGTGAPDFAVTIMLQQGASVTTSGLRAPGVYGATNTTTLTIDNAGSVNTSGDGSTAIRTFSQAGAISITNAATGMISTTGDKSAGISALLNSGSGTITIDNAGTIVTGGPAQNNFSNGIYARRNTAGTITITNSGGITTTSDTGNDGVMVQGGTAGTISITNSGTIATQGLNLALSNGNHALALYGNSVTVDNTGTGAITTAGAFSHAISVAATTVTIGNAGVITTQGTQSYGIFSFAGSGTTSITNSGSITTHGTNAAAIESFSTSGAIVITNTGSITTTGAGTSGFGAHGILAISDGGAVSVTNSNTISITGDSGRGIIAQSLYGQGTVYVKNSGTITMQGANGRGIVAFSNNAVTIVNSGAINTFGAGTIGIRASAYSSNVVINSTGTVKTYGAGAHGIVVVSQGTGQTGPVSVTANNVIVSGANASAIQVATAGTATATLTTTGTISGTLSGITVNAAGGTSLTNSGSIAAANDQALVFSGGGATIQNSGTITGHVTLTAGSDTFNNTSVFAARGNSDFGLGNNVFNNSGALTFASPGTVTLSNLQSFNNTGGVVNLMNGTPTDRLNLAGNFNGSGNSRLAVDAVLAGAGNSSADLMVVNGNTTGATAITVNNIGGTGGAGSAIPIVDVVGTTGAGDFVLANGPIRAGAFLYDLVLLPGGIWALKGSQIMLSQQVGTSNAGSVASAIDSFAGIPGNTLPPGFLSLYGLSPSQLANALTQLSGEAGTGARQGAFQLMDAFLSLLLDPSTGHRAGFGPRMGFAPERAAQLPPDVARAYAGVLKAPPEVSFAARFNVWGAAYGGAKNINGDPGGVGSHDLTARAGAVAAGLDYSVSPDTVLGFALAGGATSWSLASGLGGGRSDAFQAGLYAAHKLGPAYVSGALAYSSYWMSTDRTVTVAGTDHLTASFNAQSFGGRLEAGYHITWTAPLTITPYAAVQAQGFNAPAYSETSASGSPFALSYNSQTATAVRGELGSWFERNLALADGKELALFGRAAWAHDRQSNPALSPAFLALPGTGFVVNGAAPPSNLALVTAGTELRARDGWSLLAKLDGELAAHAQTYTGTARLRYQW